MVAEKTSTTTKRSELIRDYELVLIVTPEANEEAVNATVDNIKQLVTSRGGMVVETVLWGKKRLSYPIKHHVEGNYVLLKLEITAAVSKELEASIRITESVIRSLLTRVESK